MHESANAMWQAYLREAPAQGGQAFSAWHFCNNEQDADELAGLVLQGRKRGTASCLWTYELEGQPLPQVGDHSVILDWAGRAQCIIRTTEIAVVPFEEVAEAFARSEGEGDLSLDYWRRGHWRFFTSELQALGREPDPRMPILCERFEVVFRGSDPGGLERGARTAESTEE
jgi:uncharacterized protein YhfF